MISIIAGMTASRIIGLEGKLPWNIPEDLKNFKRLTSNSVVIMGRKTYESIGRPLPNRENIVVSRTMEETSGIVVCRSFEEAITKAKSFGKEVFLIGGNSIYREGLKVADKMYLSWIKKEYSGDTYFPEFDSSLWKVVKSQDFGEFVLKEYERA